MHALAVKSSTGHMPCFFVPGILQLVLAGYVVGWPTDTSRPIPCGPSMLLRGMPSLTPHYMISKQFSL